jgi:hypothetical protein
LKPILGIDFTSMSSLMPSKSSVKQTKRNGQLRCRLTMECKVLT